MSEIRHINLVGAGNVATNLGAAFLSAGLNINRIYSPTEHNRTALAASLLANAAESLADVQQDCDLLVLAVPDDSIATITGQLVNENLPVVHTSGSVSLSEAFIHTNLRFTGVFYPLQTLVSGHTADFNDIPICVEASDVKLQRSLANLADSISNIVHVMDSQKRLYLHLAAVMVNNFSFFLHGMAKEKLKQQQISFELLRALSYKTVENAFINDELDRQTGPARRNDEQVIKKHLELLKDDPDMKEVYELLSEKIKKKYMKS